MTEILKLSISPGPYTNTELKPWNVTFEQLAERLSKPKIGVKEGEYFVRSAGLKRNNRDTSDEAYVYILDGDSRISEDGELLDGAPDPRETHAALTALGYTHAIYTSHSHGEVRGDTAVNKFRVVIPAKYHADQLKALVTRTIDDLHMLGVMLAPVNEDFTKSQAWYTPRVAADRADLFYFAANFEGRHIDVEAIYTEWAKTHEAEVAAAKRKSNGKYVREFKPEYEGQIDAIAEYCNRADIYEVLERNGYTQPNPMTPDRWLHPASTSGSPGTVVYPDGTLWAFNGTDPLNDGHPHDAFDVMRILECRGDWSQAHSVAADFMPDVAEHNSKMYAEHKRRESAKETEVLFEPLTHSNSSDAPEKFTLDRFAVNNNIDELRKLLRDSVMVMGQVTLQGQITGIFAQSNTGKTLITLRMLTTSISLGLIDPEQVYYINADDNINGFLQKYDIAEEYGFKMLAPHFNGFDPAQFRLHMRALSEAGTAKGHIVVLDTLDSFCATNDIKDAPAFMEEARAFTMAGGTLIYLSHVNKNRGPDNKLVLTGVNALKNKSDCIYTLDEITENKVDGVKKVLFENQKVRGANVLEAAYEYDRVEGMDYMDLFYSVREIDKAGLEKVKEAVRASAETESLVRTNDKYIKAISDCLQHGPMVSGALQKAVHSEYGVSRIKFESVIRAHTGEDWEAGHRWRQVKGATPASKMYELLRPEILDGVFPDLTAEL